MPIPTECDDKHSEVLKTEEAIVSVAHSPSLGTYHLDSPMAVSEVSPAAPQLHGGQLAGFSWMSPSVAF